MRTIATVTAILLLAVVIALATGLPDRILSDDPVTSAPEESGVRGLIVQPDDGRAPILDEIGSARSTIDIMIYLMTDSRIIDSLLEAEARGVEVRVLIEQHPFGGFGEPGDLAAELIDGGVEVRWSSPKFTFTHAKTVIVDRSTVAILNFNLSRSSFERNREFGVISTWPADVDEFQEIFNADWDGERADGVGDLIVSPENSRREIIELIESADRTIDIYAEVVRDRDVIAELEAAERSGVEVRMLLSPDNEPDAARIASELIYAGVEVRYSTGLYIHAKAIVVDDRIGFVGSQNFTRTSLDENREIGIIVLEKEVVSRLISVFDADFEAAVGAF